jgi:hypothetical protein
MLCGASLARAQGQTADLRWAVDFGGGISSSLIPIVGTSLDTINSSGSRLSLPIDVGVRDGFR